MASELGFDLNSIITDAINKGFCLETTDKFPIKAYVPKLMPKINQSTPYVWTETYSTDFIKNSNFKVSNYYTVKMKNYININMDYDNLTFEDFQKGDNIEFKYKDQDVRKLYFKNNRSFDKQTDKVVLFANDGTGYEDINGRYGITIDSTNGKIELHTSNNTYDGFIKSIVLDQKDGTISIQNGNSAIILDGSNVIVKGNLIFEGRRDCKC